MPPKNIKQLSYKDNMTPQDRSFIQFFLGKTPKNELGPKHLIELKLFIKHTLDLEELADIETIIAMAATGLLSKLWLLSTEDQKWGLAEIISKDMLTIYGNAVSHKAIKRELTDIAFDLTEKLSGEDILFYRQIFLLCGINMEYLNQKITELSQSTES